MHRIFLILFLAGVLVVRPNKDSIVKKHRFLFLPVIFKSPETGFAGGISGAVYFKTTKDSLTRPSIVQAITLFTQRGQNVQAIEGTVYFPKENNVLYLQTSHAYFPDKFWGLGPNTKDDWRERYAFEQFYFYPHLKHKFANHFFAGLLYEFQYVFKVSFKEGGIFDTTQLFGKNNYKVSGTGVSCSYDTRNAAYWPTKGFFSQVMYTGFYKSFLSDFDVSKIIVDTRFFKSTFNQQVIALQAYSYITIGNSPLRELASLGGQNNLRGIYSGRYRDNSFYSFIGEYRIPVYKRFACVLFGGMGSVFYSKKEISISNLKYSYGGGLRYALLKNEHLNFRIDYGYSDPRNKGLYFTVAECF
ncbi:MAG: surface antigen [Bacteroidetes bacterium]|nr:surface antigen [Bacteroidota bacterium]